MAAKKVAIAPELQLLSLKDAAGLTRYHLKSIERFAREGQLKTVKIRGRRLTTKAYIQEFLETSLEEGVLEF